MTRIDAETHTTNCPLPHKTPTATHTPHMICDGHTERMRSNLRELKQVLTHFGDLYTAKPFSDDHNEIRIAKQDPPAPLNLAVVDLTDMRSDTPALPRIEGWVRLVAEERQLSRIPLAPHKQVGFLLLHLDWLTRHPAADEAYGEIRESWQWVKTVAGLTGAKPIFMCPVVHPDADTECGGPVFQRQERSMMVRCARCGAEWDGELELRRAGMMLGSP